MWISMRPARRRNGYWLTGIWLAAALALMCDSHVAQLAAQEINNSPVSEAASQSAERQPSPFAASPKTPRVNRSKVITNLHLSPRPPSKTRSSNEIEKTKQSTTMGAVDAPPPRKNSGADQPAQRLNSTMATPTRTVTIRTPSRRADHRKIVPATRDHSQAPPSSQLAVKEQFHPSRGASNKALPASPLPTPQRTTSDPDEPMNTIVPSPTLTTPIVGTPEWRKQEDINTELDRNLDKQIRGICRGC